jgi:hypothetical protein
MRVGLGNINHLIMAGVTIDVCLAFAAMQAVEAGYNMDGVVEASGSLEVYNPRECCCQNEKSWDHPLTGLRLRPSGNGTGPCRPGRSVFDDH